MGPRRRRAPDGVGLLQLLKQGIGIHHGGLLPILKEVIEIMFQEGLIKVGQRSTGSRRSPRTVAAV